VGVEGGDKDCAKFEQSKARIAQREKLSNKPTAMRQAIWRDIFPAKLEISGRVTKARVN
jgi:hypothetical protein